MTQLYLDFDGGHADPAPLPSGDHAAACVLVQELERIAWRGDRGRKVLIARTRGEGKELLRQVALRGLSWVGFEVNTLRPLATNIVARAHSFAGRTVIDAFDEATARGDGSIAFGGQLIDLPIVERARRTLALADHLGICAAPSQEQDAPR